MNERRHDASKKKTKTYVTNERTKERYNEIDTNERQKQTTKRKGITNYSKKGRTTDKITQITNTFIIKKKKQTERKKDTPPKINTRIKKQHTQRDNTN